MFPLISILLGVSISLLFMFLLESSLDPGKAGKTYLRLNPVGFNPIGKACKGVLGFVGGLHSNQVIIKAQALLENSGKPYGLTAREYLGIRLLLCATLGVIPLLVIKGELEYSLCGLVVGWAYPGLAVNGYANSRKNDIRRDLPYAVDLLTICISAGLGFDVSLRRVIPNLPNGVLRSEFRNMLKEIEMGKSRTDALKALADRNNLQELTSFVSTIRQAEEYGTGMTTTLPVMAEHIRSKAHLHAEASAAKAPVLMLFPLVCFIFPCILILLMAPLYLSGALNM